jgi:hypothetical protein
LPWGDFRRLDVFQKKLRHALLCIGLLSATLIGAPVRTEEIELLLRKGRETRVEASIGSDDEDEVKHN